MGLKNLPNRTREIEVPGGGLFTVRGIAFSDVLVLVSRRMEDLSAMFDQFTKAPSDVVAPEIADERARGVALAFVQGAPDLAADLIALASGELDDETFQIAKELPFPVQVAALNAIGEMTFTSEMPPKKLFEMVVKMIESAKVPATENLNLSV